MLAVFTLIVAVLPTGTLFLEKDLLNIITYPANTKDVFLEAFTVLGLLAVVNVLLRSFNQMKELFSLLCSNIVSRQVLYLIQRKAAELDLKFYDTGEYYKKLDDAKRIFGRRWDFIVSLPMEILGAITSIFTLIGTLALFNIWLVPIIFIGVIPNIVVQRQTRRTEMRFYSQQVPETRKITYTENLLTDKQFAKEIKLFGLGEPIIKLAQNLFQIHFQQLKALKIGNVKLTTFWDGFSSLTLFGVTLFITYHTILGKITVGEWMLYTSATKSIQGYLYMMFSRIASSYEENLYADVLMDFLDTKPAIEVDKGINYPTKDRPPLIEFRHVSFTYPSNEKPVLKDVSFTIGAGEKISLVGLNGAGKSTIVKLLTRLYDPDEGSILFDSVDIREYKPSDIYRLFGTVFQDFSRYAFTLNENIAVSDITRKNDKGAVERAAAEAGADRIATQLPDGFATYITKGFDLSGVSDLSGGMWQKIALARGFFRQSPVVILDEPTSALDPAAEYEVYNKFINLCRNSSALIISHRLSSVSMADRIFLLRDGQIAEAGTHHELMNLNGEYARLFNMQAEAYKKLEATG